ncbi:MAG: hemerythrin domain-containing protein [Verrucomicrobiia bacterium]
MKITDILQAEHSVFHNLFDHIEKVAPKLKTLAEVKTMASLMESMLNAHGKVEDELVSLPLEHYLAHIGQLEKFHYEHNEIDRNLKTIQNSNNVREARKLLLNAVIYCRQHFDNEERNFLPLAEKFLKATTLESLGKTYLEKRKEIIAD